MKKGNPKKLPALFIGRFQPFHLGHLDAIKQILKHEKFVIIGIGSAQYFRMKKNPFTASERYQMIEKALEQAKISRSKYTIIPIKNIENYSAWPNYVDSLLPPYDTVYTSSKIVKKLYEQQGKHKVKSLKFNKKINGTLIRKLMRQKKNWQALVPKTVAEFIEKN